MSAGPELEPEASTQKRVATDARRKCSRYVMVPALLLSRASESDKSKRRRE